jgi:dTDP-4-dehydrorhamnose reductase
VSLRVIVLGGGGMLGHKMFQMLSRAFPDTACTLRERRDASRFGNIDLFQSDAVIDGFDATNDESLSRLFSTRRPDVVVNCVGVIKQRAAAQNAVPSIAINSLLPHRLRALSDAHGTRVIHISSDCVFSGSRGAYQETDLSDADDLYGRTKALGELWDGNVVTLRTSIIGRELKHHQSLLDWFLRQNPGTVRGYKRALWSGVTTIHLAELVARIIRDHPTLRGLYHVSSGTMSKHDLLQLLKDEYRLDIGIVPDEEVAIDRSLRGERLRAAIGYESPSWPAMAKQLVQDPTPYDRWVDLSAGAEP